MHAHADSLNVAFVTDDGEMPVTVALQAGTAHSLRHLHALHAHPDGCHRSPSTHLHVDLPCEHCVPWVANPSACSCAPAPTPPSGCS